MAAGNEAGRDKGNKNNTTPALVCASVAMVMLTSDTQVRGSLHSGASVLWRPEKEDINIGDPQYS
jgi:hypothetical protein